MNIQMFEVPGLAQYSYILSSDGKAAVIDPIRDIDRYLAYATEFNLTITHIFETHIHADFASGAKALAEIAGAQLALSAYDQNERYQYSMPHQALRDGDIVEIGALRVHALHTPGHTPEHLSFLVFDTGRSALRPVCLFTGDFLFVGSLGRPDLLGDEAKHALAHRLFHSLHHRIASLPGSIEIYPGHGAGSLCGAGMSDRQLSTLGYERDVNPLFQLGEDAFVKEILASVPPMPDYYPRMKALNSEGAVSITPLPSVPALAPTQVAALARESEIILLDLRRPEAFGGAHIATAINIGGGQNLSLWTGWLLDPGKPIVLIGEAGDDEDARRSLLRVGLDRIHGFLKGGMAAWIDAGLPIASTRQLSVHQVLEHAPDALVLDVRSNSEWRSGHIPGAQRIMLGDLPSRMNEIPTSRPIIAVCGSGYRSSIAASLLAQKASPAPASMSGGMHAWNTQSLPLSHD
jgi:hydroxyacylglutathione hydrolase